MVQRILLVSDIPDHVPHYEAALRNGGYSVATSSAVADAVARAIADRPDCIVIDERVSGLRGWELCKRLKADLRVRGVPIIMLTQNTGTSDVTSERMLGCNAWLALPTTGNDLVHAVAHVLRAQRSSPSGPGDAQVAETNCPACRSGEVRAAIRVGSVQYYLCVVCGLYWRNEPGTVSAGARS